MGHFGTGQFDTGRSPQSPQETFGEEVLAAVRATGLVADARYDADAFSVVYQLHGDGEVGTIYLHNTFHEIANVDSAGRVDRIHRLVSMIGTNGADLPWEQVQPKLRPVLRGMSFGQGVPGATRPDDTRRLVSRPFLPYLAEFVVVDEPTAMAYVTSVRLDEWGISEGELFAAARANLAPRAADVADPPVQEGRPLLTFVDTGDGYFTSMLLIDGFLAGLAPRVGGRPVAFVPDKDTLLVLAEEPAGMAPFFDMVEKEYTDAVRAISPVGYTVDDDGRVVPYQAQPGTDTARAVHRAEVMLASNEYGSQKSALDLQHDEDDLDIFVASVMVMRRNDESVFSVAVWSSDVDTLLPEADYVGFPVDGDLWTVPFAIVAHEAVLVAEPDYAPARYRVTAWPSPPVMDRLRAQAVTP